jgi:hypothetical protein
MIFTHPFSEIGAQLMTSLSDLILRNPNSQSVSETLHQAELWSKKALEIAMQHSASNINNVVQDPNCDVALAFAAYNVGILKNVGCVRIPPLGTSS